MINEHKKGVKAVKYTLKTKNPVAKAHQTVGSGSGEHKDKKRSVDQVRGQKHKNKELAEFAALAPIAGAVGRAVVGGIARTAANAFADDEKTENVDDAEYNDEAGMADNNLETLHRAVVGLDELISDGDNLPEWCQEKIAVAKSMLVTVWDYMQSEEDSLSEGSKQVDELSPATLTSYKNKARAQVQASPGATNYNAPTTPKIANRARGAVKADNRLHGFGPVKKSTQDVAKGSDVMEAELSEEQLLTKELFKKFDLFKQGQDRALGNKPTDKEIMAKEGQLTAERLPKEYIEKAIYRVLMKAYPEVVKQYGAPIVSDAISSVADMHKDIENIEAEEASIMLHQVINQLKTHLHMREEKQRLDPSCWDNKKIGNPKTKMKGGTRVNNCVPK